MVFVSYLPSDEIISLLLIWFLNKMNLSTIVASQQGFLHWIVILCSGCTRITFQGFSCKSFHYLLATILITPIKLWRRSNKKQTWTTTTTTADKWCYLRCWYPCDFICDIQYNIIWHFMVRYITVFSLKLLQRFVMFCNYQTLVMHTSK